jgi:hypothetical protein
MVEKLATLAPGRLSGVLMEGLRGHHPLFDPEEIRAAFAAPDEQVTAGDATEVGQALLAICRDPIHVARGAVDGLSGQARVALIRLYFRLLDRAEEERHLKH